jgi:hypothetical protein
MPWLVQYAAVLIAWYVGGPLLACCVWIGTLVVNHPEWLDS